MVTNLNETFSASIVNIDSQYPCRLLHKHVFLTIQSTPGSRYLKVEVHLKLLISQSNFLVPTNYFEISEI